MEIKIGTFNILNTSCRYSERKTLLKQTIDSLNCDILGLQEINYITNSELFDLNSYTLSFVPLPEPMLKPTEQLFRIDGNAFLIKKSWKILQEHRLVYSSNNRVAQILETQQNSLNLLIVNTHLDHLSPSIRETQVKELQNYLQPFEFDACFITGDFNFIPTAAEYALMTQQFSSASFKANGKEPQLTFPTGLMGEFADLNPYGCLDYIWYKGKATPLACSVIRNCGHNSLWASDHYPVCSTFQLNL